MQILLPQCCLTSGYIALNFVNNAWSVNRREACQGEAGGSLFAIVSRGKISQNLIGNHVEFSQIQYLLTTLFSVQLDVSGEMAGVQEQCF